jgi:zinc protease
VISLRSLSREENLDAVVDHLAAVLADPTFPQPALERVRSQMLVGLQRDLAQPSELGQKAFMDALYRDHPYGIPPEGTPESLTAIGREDVVEFHHRYYVAANLTIAIVGDLSRERAEEVAARLAGALPVGEPAPALPPVPARDSGEVIRIPFDSNQVHILIGQPAIARGDEAFYPLYLGNHILGGSGLVSVLARELREERGLSYSSYSVLAPAAREGRFQMGTQVRADAAGEAVDVLLDSLQRLRREGPTPQQVDDAQRNITGSFPLALDSNADLVGYVAMVGFYDLGLDYLDRFPDRIAALDADDVREALQRQLHPDTMVTVLVGPESVIEAVDVE